MPLSIYTKSRTYSTGVVLYHLSSAHLKLNKTDIALENLQRAQRIYCQHYPEGHPQLIEIAKLLEPLLFAKNSALQSSSPSISPALRFYNAEDKKKTYCPYFSRTAVIGLSVVTTGVALEATRRFYFKS